MLGAWLAPTPQALRSSINEILDVYIPTRVPEAYSDLEIVICLCFGGDVREAVRDNVTQFTRQHSNAKVSFQEWNGDHLAGLMVDGILREQLVDKSLRTSFQKAVAMVDEPEVAFVHFEQLLRSLYSARISKPAIPVSTMNARPLSVFTLARSPQPAARSR